MVAGHELARGGAGPVDGARRTRSAHACAQEGHGDNAAPCALGGLRAVVPAPTGRAPFSWSSRPDVGFAYAAPAAGVSTAAARAALPKHVAHDVAVAQLGRLTALVRGLADGDPELIRIGFEDELHVPHRLPLIPGRYNAMGAGYDAGAWAVTISGSGSGPHRRSAPRRCAGPVAERHATRSSPPARDDPDCVGFALEPDFEGVRRV